MTHVIYACMTHHQDAWHDHIDRLSHLEASSDLIDSDPNLNLMVQRDDHKLVIFVSPNKGITKIYATVNLMILIITYHN